MLKKVLLYPTIAIIVVVINFMLFWEVYDYYKLRQQKSYLYVLSDDEKALLKDGDIILRYGHGLVSDYIVNLLKEEYTISHCGIVSIEGDKWEVIHSESSSILAREGIQRQDFNEFTDAGQANTIIVVRYNRTDSQGLTNITKHAQYYLDKQVPFDYSFNHLDTTAMFCSEVIWHIFLDAFQYNIFAGSEKEIDFLQFKNFWDSSQFDIILNHQENKTNHSH